MKRPGGDAGRRQSRGRWDRLGRLCLARYNTDGTLDTSFGTGGKVTTDFSGFSDQAHALAVQPDGKLVAAGRAQVTADGNVDFCPGPLQR
jgi:uncharacterized delta-60 repeat protein